MLNIKIRLQNKTFLLTFLVAIVAFIYNILSLFNIVPQVTQGQIETIITMIVNFLVMIGIVVDPTTAGVGDSERVLNSDTSMPLDNGFEDEFNIS